MNRNQKYELMYIRFSWLFIILGFAYFMNLLLLVPRHISFSTLSIGHSIAFLCILVTGQGVISLLYVKGRMENKIIYALTRIFGLTVASYAIAILDIGYCGFTFITFSILITSLVKGARFTWLMVGYSFLMHMSFQFIKGVPALQSIGSMHEALVSTVFTYLGIVLFAMICSMIYNDNNAREQENKNLLWQLREKYEQLTVAQEEIELHYARVKDTNTKLESTNYKLNASIAEFYTLYQITQAISSIFNIDQLLQHVNDIILGVMGVSCSSVIVYEQEKKQLKLHTTNITGEQELKTLREFVDCQVLRQVLQKDTVLRENHVDLERYPFTRDRNVKSLICVPLKTKTRKYGLVLVEHWRVDGFDEENSRLLGIIGQQVAIAMENAELYQRMQELAIRDGLTGIYNRTYFQERLEAELVKSEEDGSPLSLAIFDIDFFKDFNDTYGHLFGDKVLKYIAQLVSESLQEGEMVARYGGEEFIILFPGTGSERALERVERLREQITRSNIRDNLVTASITVSIGVSTWRGGTQALHDLIRSADDALYKAKEAGRNCVRVAWSDIPGENTGK